MESAPRMTSSKCGYVGNVGGSASAQTQILMSACCSISTCDKKISLGRKEKAIFDEIVIEPYKGPPPVKFFSNDL